jgi:hypothetical protein
VREWRQEQEQEQDKLTWRNVAREMKPNSVVTRLLAPIGAPTLLV